MTPFSERNPPSSGLGGSSLASCPSEQGEWRKGKLASAQSADVCVTASVHCVSLFPVVVVPEVPKSQPMVYPLQRIHLRPSAGVREESQVCLINSQHSCLQSTCTSPFRSTKPSWGSVLQSRLGLASPVSDRGFCFLSWLSELPCPSAVQLLEFTCCCLISILCGSVARLMVSHCPSISTNLSA